VNTVTVCRGQCFTRGDKYEQEALIIPMLQNRCIHGILGMSVFGDRDMELEMPELQGSSKQTAWATDIRNEVVKTIQDAIKRYRKNNHHGRAIGERFAKTDF